MNTHKKMNTNRRNRVLQVLVTEPEAERLIKIAEVMGKSVSTMMREFAITAADEYDERAKAPTHSKAPRYLIALLPVELIKTEES